MQTKRHRQKQTRYGEVAHFRPTTDQWARLEEILEAEGRELSEFLREALEEKLSRCD